MHFSNNESLLKSINVWNLVEWPKLGSQCVKTKESKDSLFSNMHSTKSNFNSTRTYFQKRISKRGSVLKVRGGCYNFRFKLYKWLSPKVITITMITINLPKLLDLLIFCIYSLNFSLEFFHHDLFCNKSAKY